MKLRILTAGVGLLALVVFLLLIDTFMYTVIGTAAACLVMHEVYSAFNLKKRSLLYVLFLFAIMTNLIDVLKTEDYILPVLFIVVLYIAVAFIRHEQQNRLKSVALMFGFAMIWLYGLYNFLHFKTLFENNIDTIYFILLCGAISWGADSFAYFIGSAIGKRKLMPKISPNKTVEGAFGGLLGSAVFSVAMTAVFTYICGLLDVETSIEWSLKYAVILVLLSFPGSIFGMIGDLLASTLKRECKVKDFGAIFPGHGGMLDRFDSVFLVAPYVVIISELLVYI